MMKVAGCLAAGLLLVVSAARAEEPIKHERKAQSTATVEVMPDGAIRMRSRNTELIPYIVAFAGGDRPRLATVTSDIRSRSDAEGNDPASSIAVTIDDLSGAAPKRLASFSEHGSEGHLLNQRYFSITSFGCCGGLDRHAVYATETGRLLFHATGDGPMGRSGWAEMPNSHPALTRWAAYDGGGDEASLGRGIIGTLAYGSDGGALSQFQLHLKGTEEAVTEMALELGSAVEIAWIDGKHPEAKPEEQHGDAGGPLAIWNAEKAKSPAEIGGFSLALRLEGKEIAVIPIVADRPMTAKARLAAGFSLTEKPAMP